MDAWTFLGLVVNNVELIFIMVLEILRLSFAAAAISYFGLVPFF
jgi:hypothetical protein